MVNKAVFAKQLEEDGGKVKSVNTLPVDYLHNTLCEPSRRTGLHIPMPRGLGKETINTVVAEFKIRGFGVFIKTHNLGFFMKYNFYELAKHSQLRINHHTRKLAPSLSCLGPLLSHILHKIELTQ